MVAHRAAHGARIVARGMTHRSVALFGLLGVASCFAATPRTDPGSFQTTIQPFVAKHCVLCHNAKLKTGGLNFEAHR